MSDSGTDLQDQTQPQDSEDRVAADAPELVQDSLQVGLAASLAPSGPTTMAKLRGLPWSIAGNSLNSIFAQFTFFGSVFVLFLNTLGLSKSQIGGLLALLPFTSVLAVFVAPAVARFGYKRTFLTAYGSAQDRHRVSPADAVGDRHLWVNDCSAFVTVIVALFAILRAIQEIGFIPWVQEFVPNAVRGKYAAKDNMFATIAGMFAIIVAGIVIARDGGSDRLHAADRSGRAGRLRGCVVLLLHSRRRARARRRGRVHLWRDGATHWGIRTTGASFWA